MNKNYFIDQIISKCLVCTDYFYYLCKKLNSNWNKLTFEERLNYTRNFLIDHPEYLFCIHIHGVLQKKQRKENLLEGILKETNKTVSTQGKYLENHSYKLQDMNKVIEQLNGEVIKLKEDNKLLLKEVTWILCTIDELLKDRQPKSN